jgi:hypothetical protein
MYDVGVTWKLSVAMHINLYLANVDLTWRAVGVFKSVSLPNVDLSWREYVSIWKDFVHPCMLQSYIFSSHGLSGNVKAALCVSFLNHRMICDLNCMSFFSSCH